MSCFVICAVLSQVGAEASDRKVFLREFTLIRRDSLPEESATEFLGGHKPDDPVSSSPEWLDPHIHLCRIGPHTFTDGRAAKLCSWVRLWAGALEGHGYPGRFPKSTMGWAWGDIMSEGPKYLSMPVTIGAGRCWEDCEIRPPSCLYTLHLCNML